MTRLAFYYLAMAIAGALGVSKGVLLASLLGVEGFGIYGLAIVMGGAFQFAVGLGCVEGLSVLLPKLLAEARPNDLNQNVYAAARMIVVRAILIALAAFAVCTAVGHPSFALAALLGLANALTTIPMVLARSQGDLRGFGLRMFLKALATLACAAVGAQWGGPDGAITGEFVGLMVALLFSWQKGLSAGSHEWRDTRSRDRELRAQGWPLLMQGANTIAQQNIERWTVAATLGLAGAGKYSFAQLFVTAVNLVHATFFQQAGSRVLARMAAGESSKRVTRQLLGFAAALGGLTFLVLIALAGNANHLLNWVFPAFGDFTWGLIWLGAAAIVQMLHHFDWILIGRSEQHVIERIAWISTVLTIALCAIGFTLGQPLEYFLFSYFVNRFFILVATFATAWMGSHRAPQT